MANTPLVSVIIPVYKAEQFLPHCLDSICAQTYKNLEIVLVDNEANKKCKEICASYASKDKRIKLVVLEKNIGPAGARQAGLARSTGELVAFVDSDDWLPVDAYQILVDLHQKTGADVVWGATQYHQPDKPPVYVDLFPHKIAKDLNRLPAQSLLIPQHMFCWDKLYTRRLLEKGLHFKTSCQMGEDIDFVFQAAKLTNFVSFTQQTVYHYLIYPTSTTHIPSLQKCQDVLAVLQEIDAFSQEHNLSSKSACRDQLLGQKCTTLIGILLYDSSNNYSVLFTQLLHALRTHKREIFANRYMGLAGKCFMMFPLAFPRLARWLFRLPGIQPLLHQQYLRRMLPAPEGKN
ncbi:MAG: glycosyltransferase family 2 protein [Elusimicrobiaceae bacterium]|nr:glycosyltransferase family 2 protein [Elusimicrobiaceae bacterium]